MAIAAWDGGIAAGSGRWSVAALRPPLPAALEAVEGAEMAMASLCKVDPVTDVAQRYFMMFIYIYICMYIYIYTYVYNTFTYTVYYSNIRSGSFGYGSSQQAHHGQARAGIVDLRTWELQVDRPS